MIERKKNIAALLFIAIACSNLAAQEELKPRFSLRLNRDLIGQLKSHGSLNARPPENYRGKLAMIAVRGNADKLEGSKKSPHIQVIGNIAVVDLDSRDLEYIESHELRFDCRGKIFSRIILKFVGDTTPAQETLSSSKEASQIPDTTPEEKQVVEPTVSRSSNSKLSRSILEASKKEKNPLRRVKPVSAESAPSIPPAFFCKMFDGEMVEGTFEKGETLKLKTLVGTVDIPIEHITGLRITDRSSGKSVVILSNGDSLSGQLSTTEFKLQTSWGQAMLDSAKIISITIRKNMEFSVSDSPFGPRWEISPETMK